MTALAAVSSALCLLFLGVASAQFLAARKARRRSEKAARQEKELSAKREAQYREMHRQLRDPADWVIVGTPDPGVGVVLMVGQKPVSFDMIRTMDGRWQSGLLGAKLPVYTLKFSGETENFFQVRADTYEEALGTLMSQRQGHDQPLP